MLINFVGIPQGQTTVFSLCNRMRVYIGLKNRGLSPMSHTRTAALSKKVLQLPKIH